ncbi:hypothetical protein AB0L66_34080 [Streptomyces sp. NPDC052207]|uniref:hypothetical protein n=1 Tax=Streptomyces sp. NPDC052207 TaxID=3155418 RepID=UPI0034475777
MDPVSASAIAAAVGTAAANAAGGEAGRTAWESLAALWRRTVHRGTDPGDAVPRAQDDEMVRAFAATVVEEGRRNSAFAAELATWARQHGFDIRATQDSINNTVSGDARVGRLIQGRDFSGPVNLNG